MLINKLFCIFIQWNPTSNEKKYNTGNIMDVSQTYYAKWKEPGTRTTGVH